jgi:hypothetical protein
MARIQDDSPNPFPTGDRFLVHRGLTAGEVEQALRDLLAIPFSPGCRESVWLRTGLRMVLEARLKSPADSTNDLLASMSLEILTNPCEALAKAEQARDRLRQQLQS